MAKRGKITRSSLRDEIIRPVRYRRYKYFILIVCEDQKTEPTYFQAFVRHFPPETVFVRTIGTGKKPRGIVDQCIQEATRMADESHQPPDEVWVIFDCDDEGKNPVTRASFEDALRIAQANQIKVACSNEVFELWLLLHFTNVDPTTPLPRKTIYATLETAVRAYPGWETFIYQHGKPDILHAVSVAGHASDAMRRAVELTAFHTRQHTPMLDANPSTSVYLLVSRLQELIQYYSPIP